MKNKFIILMVLSILSILIIANVQAIEKKYIPDSKYGKISIQDCDGINGLGCLIGLENKKAEYKLDKITSDIIDSSAEGTVTIYSDSSVFSGKEFYDIKGNEINIYSKYFILVNNTYQKDVYEYKDCIDKRSCNNIFNAGLKECEKSDFFDYVYPCETGTHKENYTVQEWVEYNNEVLKSGTYKWKLESKRPNKKIDFVLVTPFKDSLNKNIKTTEWAWWNTTWNKKAEIKIQENNNTALYNYSVYLNIPWNENIAIDFSDLRFTNFSENEALGYYLETVVNSSYAMVWIKIPYLAPNTNTSIYMYYNATVSTTSNISQAFIFGDDFSTNTSTAYNKSVNPNCLYDFGSGGKLNISSPTPDSDCVVNPLVQGINTNYIVETAILTTVSPSYSIFTCYHPDSTLSILNGVYWYIYGLTGGSGIAVNSVEKNSTGEVNHNYYHIANLTCTSFTPKLEIKITLQNNTFISKTSADTTRTNGVYGMGLYMGLPAGGYSSFDYFRVRPFVTLVPTYVIGSAINSSSISIINNYPPNGGQNITVNTWFNCSATSNNSLLNLTLWIYDLPTNQVFTVYNTTPNQNNLSIKELVSLSQGSHNWNCTATDLNNPNWTITGSTYNWILNLYNLTYLTTDFNDYVTNSKDFYINFTYDSSYYQTVAVELWNNFTNGSEIPMTSIGSGNNGIFKYNMDLPINASSYGFSYFLSFIHTSGNYDTEFVSYELNYTNYTDFIANVSDINFGECNTTLTNKMLNITARDEINKSLISSFNFQGALKYFLGSGAIFKTVEFSNNSIDSITMCNDKNANLKITGQVQIVKEGYNSNDYYFSNKGLLYNNLENLSIYLLNTSHSDTFILQVEDYQYLPLANYYIYVYRYYPDSFIPILTQVLQTNGAGQAITSLQIETVDYQFIIKDSLGNIVHTSSKSKIIPESVPYKITFVIGNPNKSPLVYYSNITGLNYQLTYDKNSYKVTYLYSDSNTSFVSSTLTVKQVNMSGADKLVCNETSNSSTDVLSCNMSGNISGSYIAQAYITRNTQTTLVNQLPFTIEGMSNVIGMIGILLAFFILLICSFLFAWNEIAGVVSINLGVIFIQLIGLMDIGWIAIGGIISVSIILLIIFER